MDDEPIRRRAYEISREPDAGTPEENRLRAEREFAVAHDYDTVERDLERLGMTLSRLPSEAGVAWRLTLPRGERVESWEPGTNGLSPPAEIVRLIGGVTAGKRLVPGPPASNEPGAARLREMLEQQRIALLTHDPGVRLGDDPENLHRHRVAARRTRAFLRTSRRYLDPDWRRGVTDALEALGEATGPARDLDVVLEHVRDELAGLDETEQAAKELILQRLYHEREQSRRRLLEALDDRRYRVLLARLRVPPRLAEGVEDVPLESLARKEYRRLAKLVGRLGKRPDEEAMHRLRIALKRARYAAELAAPKGAIRKRFLADARVLQELLGEHQDAVVAERRLRTVAVDDLRTAAAFAAGRIAERQRRRRERVHERLPAAWKRLRKSGARLV
ncbi:MAG TPA: CHAD domain-containing protein [Gaiellaceae bacterium]|nr:CHAD domain-containing protein [Gaiellaceae bacterium]